MIYIYPFRRFRMKDFKIVSRYVSCSCFVIRIVNNMNPIDVLTLQDIDCEIECCIIHEDQGNVGIEEVESGADVGNDAVASTDEVAVVADLENSCCARGPLPHGSMASSGFNLAAATLGAGTLTMPIAMAGSGIAVGAISLAIAAVATVVSIRFLILVLEKTGLNTYEALSRHFVGVWFEKLTSLLIVLFCWCITFVYVRSIMDMLMPLTYLKGIPTIFTGEWGLRLITTFFWVAFMLPLSLPKEINSLRYSSMVGMVTTLILAAAVTAHAVDSGLENSRINLERNGYANWSLAMISSLTNYTFGYCCQNNAFEIYAELKNRSPHRMTLTSGVSMACCTCVYLLVGIAGFCDFGSHVTGNILNSYPDPLTKPFIMAAYICIAITLTMSFPVCILPTRDAILQVLRYTNADAAPTKVRIAVSATLATLSLIIGLFVPGINILVNVLGGLCGAPLAFILPGFYYLKAFEYDYNETGLPNFIVAWMMIVVGFFAGLGGTTIAVVSAACPACMP